MISHLRGEIYSKGADSACIDVAGVGYFVQMPQTALANLPQVGNEAVILCRMVFSDAGAFLYGFSSEHEREVFDALISVNGIGPKTAIAGLSVFSSEALVSAIANEDVKSISKIPGVGKKSASRIVLELKDKFASSATSAADDSTSFNPEAGNMAIVAEALAQMGFTDTEISGALDGADANLPESVLLQYALKKLA